MRDIGRNHNKGYRCAAGYTGAQIMSGKAELTNVRGQPPAFFQRVLNRMHCGKSLRTEQQEG
jgi:hypothetical protein